MAQLTHALSGPWALAHQIPGGLCVVSTQVLHVGGKALVQPQVIPPGHCDQVPKPLQGQGVSPAGLLAFLSLTNGGNFTRDPASWLPPPFSVTQDPDSFLTPGWGYLVGQLVRNHSDHPLLVADGGRLRVEKQRVLPVGHQPPVLHGASIEVRKTDLVWGVQTIGGCVSGGTPSATAHLSLPTHQISPEGKGCHNACQRSSGWGP